MSRERRGHPPRSLERERLDVVLLHELVHIKRMDPFRPVPGQCVLALYWFHPLVWCAVRIGGCPEVAICLTVMAPIEGKERPAAVTPLASGGWSAMIPSQNLNPGFHGAAAFLHRNQCQCMVVSVRPGR